MRHSRVVVSSWMLGMVKVRAGEGRVRELGEARLCWMVVAAVVRGIVEMRLGSGREGD